MPDKQELKFGPKMEAYFKEVQQMAQQKVEIEVGGTPELVQLAEEAEYGLGEQHEQPFLRPALGRVLRDMDRLLKEGGVEAVREAAEAEVAGFVRQNIDDPELAEKIANSVDVRVVG